MAIEAFTPIIDAGTGLSTCVQVASGAGSASTQLTGRQVLIKCLTNPIYMRLGASTVTVSSTNGYYMAVGDEVRWQVSKGATYLAYIQVGGAGALSICPGISD